ncbi:MAG: hypothetical protein WD995_04020 [Gemmatimonadota bacterium]
MSTKTRMFVLVALAFLPTLGLYLYANRSIAAAHRMHQEAELLHQADRMGLMYERILSQSEVLLGALSKMPELRNPRQPQCNEMLSSIMGHLTYYTAIQLIEADGFVACGSLAIDESLYVGDRYYHQAALNNRQFTVGNFNVGRLTGKPIVGLAYPIERLDTPDLTGVLAVYLDLDELANSAYETGMPRAATFTVVDREGRVMVRVPSRQSASGADTVGASVPASFPTPTGEFPAAYLASGVDLDGVERLFALRPLRASSSRASGHVYFGLAEETLSEGSSAVALRYLQILALSGVFLLVLAWLFSRALRAGAEPRNALG